MTEMSPHRPGCLTLVVACICIAAVFLSACGLGDDGGTAAHSSGPTPSQTSTSTVLSSGSQPTPDASTTVPPSTVGSELSCDGPRSLEGDLDGDGVADRIGLGASPPLLVVCTTTGSYAIEVGAIDIVEISDVDLDGRDEILVGGTTAWGRGVEIVALVDHQLGIILDASGMPLTMWRGLPPDRVLASGCGAFVEEDGRQIAILDGTVGDGSVEWRRTIYRIAGHRAVELRVDMGTLDIGDAPDPLSVGALGDLVGDPC